MSFANFLPLTTYHEFTTPKNCTHTRSASLLRKKESRCQMLI